ncbi:hypothetical protein MNBD_ALPHA07-1685 [hydrothermal vent metagenome]|uniref:Hedgehog/Intein (Hint) domain-containing protein n=1 Tax=hydrothermal vent metagenome TaxID=652676 RepID=A0A3B0RND7_9ZZZZ
MNITYPGVNQTNTNTVGTAPNEIVLFDGDGVRGGPDDDEYNSTAPAVVINFDQGVSDVSFTIFDVDASTNVWDDQIRVIATDGNGNPVEISISLSDPDIVIESDGSAADGFVAQVDGSNNSDGGNATFTIAGPVTNIQIFYENGNDFSNDLGIIGFQMNTFGDVLCFCRGTMIETKTGARAVENLREGDLILTRDNGYQPLRWVTNSRIGGHGPQAPIKIAAGALGNDTELMVSPLHKMLISGWRAELCMGVDEALVMAKSLVNGDTIRPAPCQTVEYFHIMFDRHEIILSNNCWSESFYPGRQALRTLDQTAREDLFSKFPELVEDISTYGQVCTPVAKAHEGELIAAQ